MIIKEIEVEYRELRSQGYPSYNNVTHGITLRAQLEEDDSEGTCRTTLQLKAKQIVKTAHGDDVDWSDKVAVKAGSVSELRTDVRLLSDVLRGGFLNGEAAERLADVEAVSESLFNSTIPF